MESLLQNCTLKPKNANVITKKKNSIVSIVYGHITQKLYKLNHLGNRK